jgi:hypothetical protein
MKTFLLFSILMLLVFSAQRPCKAQDSSGLTVIDFSWSRYHQALDAEPNWDAPPNTAHPPMTDADKKVVERRYGDLMRSAELKKVERDAARSSVRRGEYYIYKVKLKNTDAKTIRLVFWEYQIIELANRENLARRQFLCAVKIKADDKKGIEAFSPIAPTANVVSAKTLGKGAQKLFEEKAVINRIEYTDGSTWQRADWAFPEVRTTYPANVPRSMGSDVCRGF